MSKIKELRIVRGGQAHYIYFAKIGGQYVDLAPYGNRLP